LGAFEVTVIAIIAWNLYAVRKLAPEVHFVFNLHFDIDQSINLPKSQKLLKLKIKAFPNFPYARATVLVGDNLGHSWVGLLLARSYDPLLQVRLIRRRKANNHHQARGKVFIAPLWSL
jgi:hypothetical protein